jgi:hypothetical protein
VRSIVLALLIFIAETSLSYAQGQMGTPQERRPAHEMRSAFADRNWAMMERFNNACSRTEPG